MRKLGIAVILMICLTYAVGCGPTAAPDDDSSVAAVATESGITAPAKDTDAKDKKDSKLTPDPTQKPSGNSSDKSSDKAADTSSDKSSDKAADSFSDKSSDKAADSSFDKASGNPAGSTIEETTQTEEGTIAVDDTEIKTPEVEIEIEDAKPAEPGQSGRKASPTPSPKAPASSENSDIWVDEDGNIVLPEV